MSIVAGEGAVAAQGLVEQPESNRWAYTPTEYTGELTFHFPDDFEWGAADGDDAVFERAWWHATSVQNFVGVRFMGIPDDLKLESERTFLIRHSIPDRLQIDMMDLQTALDSLVKDCTTEALFESEDEAVHACLMLDGFIIRETLK